MLYDVAGGHIILHIVVFDVEHPRRMSKSTSYLTQLSKAMAHTFHDHKKAYLAILLNKARDCIPGIQYSTNSPTTKSIDN